MWVDALTPQKRLDSFSPYGTPFVEMHLRLITLFQPVNCSSQFLTKPFILDLLDRVRIRMERKHQRLTSR